MNTGYNPRVFIGTRQTQKLYTKTNVCSINSDISYSENEVSNNQPIQKGEIKQLTIHDLTSVCKYGYNQS